jgi:hypothetical protein
VRNEDLWRRVREERIIIATIKRTRAKTIVSFLRRVWSFPTPYRIEDWRKDRRKEKTRKKMLAYTGRPQGTERILEIEKGSTRSHAAWTHFGRCYEPVATEFADWINVTPWFSRIFIQIFRGFRLTVMKFLMYFLCFMCILFSDCMLLKAGTGLLPVHNSCYTSYHKNYKHSTPLPQQLPIPFPVYKLSSG